MQDGWGNGCEKVVVELRLVASVSELESGCIVAELALGFPKVGRPSVGGARARCPALRDSKTQGKWTSTRARGESCANRPQVVQGTCAPTGAARLRPPDVLRLIRGRSSGSGETRATELPKPSAALFAQVLLATNCTPARASLRDSLSLGGYALGFPPRAGVSPSLCAAKVPRFAPAKGGRWRRGGVGSSRVN